MVVAVPVEQTVTLEGWVVIDGVVQGVKEHCILDVGVTAATVTVSDWEPTVPDQLL